MLSFQPGTLPPKQALVLAAGKSSRLGALGSQVPKPLVPICGHPAMAFVLKSLENAGFDRAVVNLHHLGNQIRTAVQGGLNGSSQMTFRLSNESEILGTGGGALWAQKEMLAPGPFLIANAKVVADVNMGDLWGQHVAAAAQEPNLVATMLLRPDASDSPWAPVMVESASDRVVGIRGEFPGQSSDRDFGKGVEPPLAQMPPVGDGGLLKRAMFTGIHVVTPRLLKYLPQGSDLDPFDNPGQGSPREPPFSDIIAEGYLRAMAEGGWCMPSGIAVIFQIRRRLRVIWRPICGSLESRRCCLAPLARLLGSMTLRRTTLKLSQRRPGFVRARTLGPGCVSERAWLLAGVRKSMTVYRSKTWWYGMVATLLNHWKILS